MRKISDLVRKYGDCWRNHAPACFGRKRSEFRPDFVDYCVMKYRTQDFDTIHARAQVRLKRR